MDFQSVLKATLRETSEPTLQPVIEKELLHYAILRGLANAGMLDRLTFQGGTALRLCYGSSRYSEDLDFAGGTDFDERDLENLADVIDQNIGQHYGLEVSVKEPKPRETDSTGVNVDTWQVSVITAPTRRDIPKQRIKIEVASIPAYSREAMGLRRNHAALPDGIEDTILHVESLDEIMADKLLAFVVTRHIRHRDLWDLTWLTRQGAQPSLERVRAKIADYRVPDYLDRLTSRLADLSTIVRGGEFHTQMSRFLPRSTVEDTLEKPEFLDYVTNTVGQLLRRIEREMKAAPDEAEFRM